MDAPPPFSDKEIAFLDALVAEGVEFLIVGLAAAALHNPVPGPPLGYRGREPHPFMC